MQESPKEKSNQLSIQEDNSNLCKTAEKATRFSQHLTCFVVSKSAFELLQLLHRNESLLALLIYLQLLIFYSLFWFMSLLSFAHFLPYSFWSDFFVTLFGLSSLF